MASPKEYSASSNIHMRQAAAILLFISSLLLSSCAGFRLPPEEGTDNRPRISGSADIRYIERRDGDDSTLGDHGPGIVAATSPESEPSKTTGSRVATGRDN